MTRFGSFFLVIIFLFVDQATKFFARLYLPFHDSVEILPFFSLHLTYNRGIAFSFLSDFGNTSLILISFLITAFVIFLWSRLRPDQYVSHIGYGLIVSGAIGNMIDRVIYEQVTDFFLFHTTSWNFAIFNVADSCITVGALFILSDEFLFSRNRSSSERSSSETGNDNTK